MLKQETTLANQQPQLSIMMNMESGLQSAGFNQRVTIQPAFDQTALSDNSSGLTNRLAAEPVDDLQTTLQDLKDCDNEFSTFL